MLDMQPKVRRVVSLLRVSTTMVEQSESPEAQRLFIQEQIRRNQTEGEVWIDTGFVYQDELTGSVVMNRPDIKRLVSDIAAGKFDMVLMKSIKRLGRDTLGLLTLKRFLDDHGVELVGLQDGYRSSRDMELIFLIHADRAQAEREDLAKNVRNAMRQRAQQGRWTCGKVPFGYRRKTRHELEHHPETAPVIHEIFRLRRAGWSLDRITRFLNESHIPAPNWWEAVGRLPKLEELHTVDERYAKKHAACKRLVEARKGWHFKTVTNILENTAYYGELRYNRRFWKTLSSQGGKKVLQTRDKSEVIVVPCPPLMDREEWAAAQNKLRVVSRSTARHVYLLSGILTCEHCGGPMSGGGTGHNKARPYYGYYYCTSMRKGLCSCKSVRSQRLERAVLERVSQHLANLEEYEIVPVANVEAVKLRLRQVEAKLADLKDERRYYRDEHRRSRLSDEELDQELSRISDVESQSEALMQSTKQELDLPEILQRQAEKLRLVAGQLMGLLSNAPAAGWTDDDRRGLKSLLLLTVNRIVYRGEDDFDIYLQLPPSPSSQQAEIG
jgi:site-specific DNA recombinase